MNGFLVVVRSMMDDAPVRLFASEKAAMRFAKKLDKSPEALERIRVLLDVGSLCDDPTDVVEFHNGRRVEEHWKKALAGV